MTMDDGAGEGARTPLLTLAGYQGSLEALLTLARARRIAWEKISVPELVDQLAAAVQDAPAATPLARKGDWLVMAAWLVQLRSRLLLPAEAPAQQAAADAADRFRQGLSRLADVQALAAWLEARPQLGRDVFGRGHPFETCDPATASRHDIDVIEFLWASMALFDDDTPGSDVADSYRPPARNLYAAAAARVRILQRLAGFPGGLALQDLLPDEARGATQSLRTRSAWTSTLIASLELTRQGNLTLAQTVPFSAVHVRPAPADPPP
jgi:segregation and condensation protein A